MKSRLVNSNHNLPVVNNLYYSIYGSCRNIYVGWCKFHYI